IPGARPTITSLPFWSPKPGTGALNQSGSRARLALRKSASLGQSAQSRSGSVSARRTPPGAEAALVVEVVAIAPRRHAGRTLQELRSVMARLAGGRPLGRVAAQLGLQFNQIGEDVGLAPQLVGNHRRLARDGRDDG